MNRVRPAAHRRGFTLIEAGALVVLTAAGAAMGLSAQPLERARNSARQIKDSTQIRALLQANLIFAQQNNERFPMPGEIDRNDTTVKATAAEKNTTANIFSMHLWNGMISPEVCVSPAENNPNIAVANSYEFTNPTGAVKPAEALWDPKFSADFTGGKTGHVSYAHQMLFGERLKGAWMNTFSSTTPVYSTRGPEMTAVRTEGDLAWPTYAKAKSNTFSFFLPHGSWSGNVGFADAHVEFIPEYLAPGRVVETAATYPTAEGVKKPDMAFFDEPDDPTSVNNFLSIFVKAGAKREDFKAIWD